MNMDDNNSNFLDSYKRKYAEKTEQPAEELSTKEAQSPLKYEEKSGFVKPQQMKEAGAQPPPKRPKYLIPVIIAGVLVLAVIIGLLIIFSGGTEVIDFTNWTVNDAQLWARDHKVVLQVQEEYNDKIDAGKVISQNVPKGTKVEQNSFIQLKVSLGHDLTVSLPLPDLMSMTKDEVEAWAAANFMAKVRITTEFSDKVPSGKVIRYEINDTTVVDKVTRNTPIYVIVSKGREDASNVQVTVPNFKEKTLAECYTFANENGIILTVKDEYDDFVPKGSVISQSVKADEKISKGDEIILTVSKGKMITIPSFSGYTKEKASAKATELGIPVTIIEKYSSASAGAFISQSIKADTVYEDGDILVLYFSLGNKIVVSSFVGQTRDAIESWAKDLNEHGASITIRTTYTQSSSSKGKIIFQDTANTVIGIKATINITVSRGKVVIVPNFVAPEGSDPDTAITREEAIAMCESLNIVPVFVAEVNEHRGPDEVWYQSITAGTQIFVEETTITLKYNPVNTLAMAPGIEGMPKADALAGNLQKLSDISFLETAEHVPYYANKVYQ